MIIDTNRNTTRYLSALKNAGVTGIIRYDNRLGPNNEKQVKSPEARAIADAGLSLGIVYEGQGDRASAFSRDSGRRDAAYSLGQMKARGQPPGSAVYFAVDFDAVGAQIGNNVLPYFRGVADSLVGSNVVVGVYGSGLVCRSVLDAGLASLAWLSCSMGWSESRAFAKTKRWTLLQHLPKDVAGIDCDANDLRPGAESWGGFVPYDDGKPLPPIHDEAWLQGQLGVAQDGIVGPDTIAAMIHYVEDHQKEEK